MPSVRATSRYGLGVAVLVSAIVSQYFLPAELPALGPLYHSLAGGVALVYVVPVVAFALLVGPGPLRHWRTQPARSAALGLGWYGSLSLLALLVTAVLAVVLSLIDPSALGLLRRENPALRAAASDPWFYVGFSFVIGAFEEVLFRGWVFGFWVRDGGDWLLPAVLSSGLFAAVHLYYGTTYGAASLLVFPTLFLVGFAFAATYQRSGGNLLVPSLLHGANDATAFLTLVSLTSAEALHWGIVLVGALVALLLFVLRPAVLRPAGPTLLPPGPPLPPSG